MKRLLSITLSLLLFNYQLIITDAEVRFVSKTGSSTPPYTSWATAADSIQKCINISQSGDTIYVANGTYYEQVVMIPGLALIGSGMDSCIINTKAMAAPGGFTAVKFADSCLLKGFTVDVSFGYNGDAVEIKDGIMNGIIEENQFINSNSGCYISGAQVEISKNIFKSNERCIEIMALPSVFQQNINNNVFTNIRFTGIGINVGAQGEIRNNFFYLDKPLNAGFFMGLSEGLNILNNTIVADTGQTGISNSLFQPINNINNIVIGGYEYAAILTGTDNQIVNNIVVNSDAGIRLEEGHSSTIKYNDIWNNRRNYINFTPDSTNLSVDPMLYDEENEDFHLQKFSPLIDAGDPNILDKDSSRSDIGVYGGPFGENYPYIDLAPKPPRNIVSEFENDTLKVWWNSSTESDFKQYIVYKDTTAGFQPDSSNRLFVTDTSYFWDLIQLKKNIYYKITSVDNQNNESEPGEEIAVIVTALGEKELVPIDDYKLYQNYPNPFNPSTKIGFRLKENGNVRIVVYDIKGELIEELINEYQAKGYHEVSFTGKTDSKLKGIASGVYIYRIEVKNENSIPVFGDMKKMIFLK